METDSSEKPMPLVTPIVPIASFLSKLSDLLPNVHHPTDFVLAVTSSWLRKASMDSPDLDGLALFKPFRDDVHLPATACCSPIHLAGVY